ncbi:hypothetical protein KBC40_00060 [Patescibacteria group bacterium]|jgi:hypothetical protein|nr:hypothetical protein [Patescibacteria group bacterium]
MTNNEKIERIKEVYLDFLAQLQELKADSKQQNLARIQAIEKQEIDKILDKIHKDF